MGVLLVNNLTSVIRKTKKQINKQNKQTQKQANESKNFIIFRKYSPRHVRRIEYNTGKC